MERSDGAGGGGGGRCGSGVSGPEPTNNLSCRGVYPRPNLTADERVGSSCDDDEDDELMEGDPWFPTVEDYLHCPPPGWEWAEVCWSSE